jgi:MFS family permease
MEAMTTKSNNQSIPKAKTLLGLQFISDFGDQISIALLALCLLDITQSASKVGLVYFTTTVGCIAFALVGGIIGDRLSKKNILFYSDLGRGFVVLLMILALREKSIFLIYCTSFLLSLLGSLHLPAKLSIWADSIPSYKLERYNYLSQFLFEASTILGPLIASIFIMKQWTNWGFAIDSITFFICAIVFAQIVSARGQAVKSHQADGEGKKDFLKGFKIILKRPDMSKYIAYDAIQMIGFSAFNATFLVLAQRDFGWSKDEYSYHLSIVALFTMLAAIMGATRYMAKIDQTAKLIWCALLSALALAFVLHLQSFPLSSLLMGICDGLVVLTMAATKTKVQLIAKDDYPNALSSIMAARYIVIKAAMLLGTGSCLLIGDLLSLEATLALFVVPIGLSCLPFVLGQKEVPSEQAMSPISTPLK